MTVLTAGHALALALAAVFLAIRATLMGLPQFGWIARPWYVRFAMGLFATTILLRAWNVFRGDHVIHPTQHIAAFALCFWQAVELTYQMHRAKVMQTAGLVDRAQKDAVKAALEDAKGRGVAVYVGEERR